MKKTPRVVWKFHVDLGVTTIPMPENAGIVSAAVAPHPQRGFNLWAIVNPDNKLTQRTFSVIWTGERAPDPGYHIATIAGTPGGLVYHIFEGPL